MHIPDGYLSPSTSVVLTGMMLPIWNRAARKVSARFDVGRVPLIAIGAAFSFVIMMINIPVPDGTTAHAVGGTLLAITLGPWAATLALSVATLIQALFFGDGGILAYGANALNMAVILPFAGYYIFRLIRGRSAPGSWRYYAAASVGAYVGIVLAGLATGFELGIQPALFHTAAGVPLYSPYGLKVALRAMAIAHFLVAGPVEAAVTGLALAYIFRTQPNMLAGEPGVAEATTTGAAAMDGRARPAYRALLVPLGILVVLTPIGLLAKGTAWGEWGLGELGDRLGYAPSGLVRLSAWWHSLLPDYTLGALEATGSKSGAILGYLVSGLVGLAVIGIIAGGLIIAGRRRTHAGPS
jgi:cobalt/nickel transport system permease protein